MDFDEGFDETIISRKPWENDYKEGKTAFETQDFKVAEKFLLSALNQAKKYNKDDPRLGNIHTSLAELFQAIGNKQKAASHFQSVIEIWGKTLGNDYSGLKEVYRKIIPLLRETGKNEEAQEIEQMLIGVKKEPNEIAWKK